MLKPGLYQHYKGKKYQVIGTANHSETLEKMVVYKALYLSSNFEFGVMWVRPLAMFTETVTIEGNTMPRFTLIEQDV